MKNPTDPLSGHGPRRNLDGSVIAEIMVRDPILRSVDVRTIDWRLLVFQETPGLVENMEMENNLHSSMVCVPKDRESVWPFMALVVAVLLMTGHQKS